MSRDGTGLSCPREAVVRANTRERTASDSMGLSCSEKVMAWRMVVASRCNPLALASSMHSHRIG